MKEFVIGCGQFLAGALVGFGIAFLVNDIAPHILSTGWFISTFAVPIVIVYAVNGPARLLFIGWGGLIGAVFAWSILSRWFQIIGSSIRGLTIDHLALIVDAVGILAAVGSFVLALIQQLKGTTTVSKSKSPKAESQQFTVSDNATQINNGPITINNISTPPQDAGNTAPKTGQFKVSPNLDHYVRSIESKTGSRSDPPKDIAAEKRSPAGRRGIGGAG